MLIRAFWANELIAAPTYPAHISGVTQRPYVYNALAMIAGEGIYVLRVTFVVINIIKGCATFLSLDAVRLHGKLLYVINGATGLARITK